MSGTDFGTEPDAGTVYLVGSGPGDPELLTCKARRLLEQADFVLHDKLPGPKIIDLLPDDRRKDVGKRAHGDRTPQSEINELLVQHARDGQSVVRLKGGDSFVFGRGGEEAEYLAAHGIPFEVVPAVTSAVAAPAVAGIPVTHRDHASSVSFVTGHEDPTKPESTVNWAALADTGGTIVVLMGVTRLPDYTDALLEAGMPAETPVALVERATWPNQQVATGTLETIVDARDSVGIEPPAITVIGDVAGTRESVVEFLANESAAGASDSATSTRE
ncbi:uroporphyrinogen-III C-methyltransferase [Natronolimnobius baerhuensis]|uniref:uroporphyrinogen-III C-methyltransferase n=1 Tax=Natronolimnobius baerhuensis TaxID=253108 RepID=A0A202E5A8_9EURY|nr:uroporphyrinogen-III C-methyltransferase [Natronolimnobius baerhuensis]OVE83445.1 uroporphyrinogen-III C-methyltransferase [Natronolimnobius baerhuensis]